MIHNEAEAIMQRLGAIDGVQVVTRGWPRRMENLPCIAVAKVADTPAAFRDDREHVAQLEYYIRIFAHRAQQTDELAVCVDNAMEEMGYVRTFSYDGEDADVRMAVLRYRKYV